MIDSQTSDLPAPTPSANFLADGGEMGELMRGLDWSTSPLGPPETWPDPLKMSVSICLNSRFPMVLWWGSEFVMLYNDAWRPVLGATKHPGGLGRPGIESWPEIWDVIGEQLAGVMAGEASWSEDLLLVLDRYGYSEEAYFTYSYSPIKNAQGGIVGVFSAVNETTERVLGERRLRILRDLAEQTADAKSAEAACASFAQVLGKDNPDLPLALLYLADEAGLPRRIAVAGLDDDDPRAPHVIGPDEKDPWRVGEVLRTGLPALISDLAARFGNLPGGAWPEPTTAALVLPVSKPGHQGDATGVLVAGVNPRRSLDDAYRGFLDLVAGQMATAVSNARAYETERRRTEALAEIDRAKTAFFSNVSHEFRTPLTLMLGPLEDALHDEQAPLVGAQHERLETAHRNSLRLLKLVNTLLDFSRIEAGRMEASFQDTDLAAATSDLASTFRSAIERAGLRLSIECRPLPHPVYVDRDMWENIVLNLVSNAFKFTFQGEIAVRVEAASDMRSALISICDTGIGIPASELPKLFDRFHRVAGAQGRSFEGSGIGLALVQELVKLHGGHIAVESTLDQGTSFTVSLPFGRSHLPADHILDGEEGSTNPVSRAQDYIEEASRWMPEGKGDSEADDTAYRLGLDDIVQHAGTRRGDGKRVLVADDNADMRAYLRKLLEAQGFAVAAVADGLAALAATREAVPDLVLSDVMMPRLDGFGLLRALRDGRGTASVPVILLSARAGEEAKIEGLEAGADDYLVKPFTARELLARVGATIQMSELRREANRAIFKSEQQALVTQDRLSLALSTGRVAVFEWAVDENHLTMRGPLAQIFGVTLRDAEDGLPLEAFTGAIHADDRAGVRDALNRSVETGAAYEAEYRVGRGEDLRVVIARGRMEAIAGDLKRMVGVVIDITEEKVAQTEIEENRAYLRELLDSTGEGFYAVDRDGVTTVVNRAFLKMLGFAREEDAVGRKLHDIIHHTHPNGDAYPVETCPIYKAASTGEAAYIEGEFFYRCDGSSFPVEYRAHPILREGQPAGAICTFVDISERLAARREIEAKQLALQEQTSALRLLNKAAAAVAGDLDLERLVQTVTDAAVEVTGAEFGAFFYNVTDAAGESFMLYSLSGVPREAFSKFPMPRNTEVFAPTFRGEGVVRSDDITKDPRYGKNTPRKGMPEGHLPVRSYLAAPVRSRSGEVLGGIFFGHSRSGVFGQLSEDRIVGLAAQAAVAMDNARLFKEAQHELEQRRRAEEELHVLNASLEERVASEVAERAKAEDALRQAQKMEAVGQLTGGVAHDFNNLLTIIIGGLDTIRRSKPGDEVRMKRAIDMATQGAQRAAGLTSRLLSFSRRQALAPKPLELNVLVRDMTELLHRTLGEQVELEGVLAPRLWTIEADQNQLESAIINLAVNARDAMQAGGKLTIETANTMLDHGYVATDAEVIPGQYVVVSISDTGSGIPKDTLHHVFEPFFTTKEVGRGTGLGLSMVYGFVKQSGGHVTIYSEEGQGTTVKLYFPRYLGAGGAAEVIVEEVAPLSSDGEVILVVEDNDDVRAYSVMVLTELGYQVLEAPEVDSALAILRAGQRIDLLFTDVVLPGKSGRVLADAAAELRPGLKVLFTTGYSRNAIVHHGRLDPGVQLISKPFTFEQLAARVRDILDL